jgi:uncharacterized protein (DUF1778 family)
MNNQEINDIINSVLKEHQEYLKEDIEDGKETIELDLTQDEINMIALAAHKRNMTLNEFISQVLEAFIDVAEEELDDE